MKRKILVRADANNTIGSGHVMRCLSIARVARARGIECLFVSADENTSKMAAQQQFECINLESKWNDLELELPKLLEHISAEKTTDILLDSYYVTPTYMQALRQASQLHYIDDLMMFHYPCDTLINYNAAAPFMGYEGEYGQSGTQFLLGPQYAPLRAEFQGLPKFKCKQKVKKVLITTGGSDPLNIAGKLIKILKNNPATSHLELHVIAGSLTSHFSKLLELQKETAGVVLYQNAQNMAELMSSCDIAVTAGGSTMYELCACGVPSVFFTFADNQHMAIEPFTDKLMMYAGDVRKEAIEKIATCVVAFLEDKEKREGFSEKMQTLVDGCGAERILNSTLLETKVR